MGRSSAWIAGGGAAWLRACLQGLILVLGAIAAFPTLASAQPSCPQFFSRGTAPALLNPKLGQRVTVLCNEGYAVAASGITRGTLWSAEHVTAAGLASAQDTRRVSAFHPEERLPPEDQAQISDYRASGYDRGHMAPSGDMPNATAQAESFSLANVVPQTSQLNRSVWEGIESAVRTLAQQQGELYLVTGPAFIGSKVQAIGSGVLVPTSTSTNWPPSHHHADTDATDQSFKNLKQKTRNHTRKLETIGRCSLETIGR